MKKKYSTILVVPENGGDVKEYHFSKIKLLIGVSIILAGFLSLYFFSSTIDSLKIEYNELVNIKEENARVDKRLAIMSNNVLKLKKSIETVNESEENIQEIVTHLEKVNDKRDFNSIIINKETTGIDSIRIEIAKLSVFYDSLFRKIGSNKQKVKYLPTYYPVSKNIAVSVPYGPQKDPFSGVIKMHEGSDFAGSIGEAVYCTADGWVTSAQSEKGFGNTIKISHGNGYETVYSHLHRMYVRVGNTIVRGKRIGTIGKTGQAIGPHLHYEIRHNSKALNPEKFFLNK